MLKNQYAKSGQTSSYKLDGKTLSIIESENRKKQASKNGSITIFKIKFPWILRKMFLELPLSGDNCQYC